MNVDIAIVGGGAAGLTAAIFSARRGLRTLVITQDIGGQAATTAHVENYPGVAPIDGYELMKTFQRQAETAGARIRIDEVNGIARHGDEFRVTAGAETVDALVVILAYGLTHKHLNVPGEARLIGRGVSYCATCDVPAWRGQPVAVVGGGNAAMDAALLSAAVGCPVTLVTTHPEFRGERVLIDRVAASPKIKSVTDANVVEILGDAAVTGLVYEQGGQRQKITVDGVLVQIGFTVRPDLVRGLTDLDPRNQIIVNPSDNRTSVPGLFAAGDVTNVNQKQIVISAGEGAKAALGAYQYLQGLGRIGRGGVVDWGVATPHRHEQLGRK